MSAESSAMPFVLVDGQARKTGVIEHTPFTFGRLPENDIVLAHPFVSRKHAELVLDQDDYYIVDCGSLHGTYVNGHVIQNKHRIKEGDSIHFGSPYGPSLQLGNATSAPGSTIREIVEKLPAMSGSSSGLEKLRWFFESARKLNAYGTID